ncbi:MAG: M13 family metallopeptidase [Muribaculaceae bacterium]|nr:M13 family metallopeptidase [Muribaculaceae bacterium]
MKKGIDISNLDISVNPKQDFYDYATGGWRKDNPLQGEYASFGVFNQLAEDARDNVRNIIENLSEHPEAGIRGSIAQKISDLYSLGMDIERRNSEGIRPLKPILEKIENYTKKETTEYIAWLSKAIDNTFFSFGVGPDPADSKMNILHLSEAGLGLGDRDYYLEKNENNDKILNAYRIYLTRIMTLAGYSAEDASRMADTVIQVETEYASHKKTREERRDPVKSYHIMSMEELCTTYPNFDWEEIFRKSGLNVPATLNVSSPKFVEFVNEYYPKLNERQITDLMLVGAVTSATGTLSEDFYDADFEMFSRVMSGTEDKKPLWKRVMAVPNAMFGEAVGQLYVEKYFPEENKTYMKGLVENLRKSLGKHIAELPWMSEETKTKALEKLAALKVKIGYPDKWKDYSGIDIDPTESYQSNVLKAAEWFALDNYSKLGKPVDETEWFMYPQTVNAYYSPQMNEICFPAGILQPPFFDMTADDAQNYGAIGTVIGHEMTHGFDDSGRKFDSNGNLNDWWSKDDTKKFEALTDKLVTLFNEVEVAPGVKANGRFTLGENIADQGGLRVSLTAYDMAMEGKEQPVIDNFTPRQRFYLSYASVWANNIRDEEILVRTKTDPHSLPRNRVNVTLSNIAEFLEAFNIEEGDKMWRAPEKRVVVW